jgi:hypothetical protein
MRKLESTKKITIGSTIRVYRKGFGYSILFVIGNNDYYLAGLASDDFASFVTDSDTVEAYFWPEDVSSYEFNLMIIGRISVGPRILFFGHTEDITRNAERKCLTAEVNIPIKFFTFDPGERERGITSEEIVTHAGSIILLSDREATIRSTADISGCRFLKGHIILDNETIELVGMVDVINEKKNIYNLLFAGMSDRVRNLLLDYIFSIYRE